MTSTLPSTVRSPASSRHRAPDRIQPRPQVPSDDSTDDDASSPRRRARRAGRPGRRPRPAFTNVRSWNRSREQPSPQGRGRVANAFGLHAAMGPHFSHGSRRLPVSSPLASSDRTRRPACRSPCRRSGGRGLTASDSANANEGWCPSSPKVRPTVGLERGPRRDYSVASTRWPSSTGLRTPSTKLVIWGGTRRPW